MICPRCGNQIADTVKFCPVCGNPVAAAAAVQDKEGSFNIVLTDEDEALTKAIEDKDGSFAEAAEYKEEVIAEAVKDKEGAFTEKAEDPERYMNGTAEKETKINGFAIAALIMGIVSVPCGYLLLIPNILAIVFGIIGITKASSAGTGRAMAVAGLILGIVAALLWVTIAVVGIALLGVVINIMNF